jgi:hypothetical protein
MLIFTTKNFDVIVYAFVLSELEEISPVTLFLYKKTYSYYIAVFHNTSLT